MHAALRHDPENVLEAWVETDRRDKRMAALLNDLQRLGVAVHAVERRDLDRRCAGAAHQGVAIRYRQAPPLDEAALERLLDGLDHPAFLLVLDQVQDPHNLGACMRSADAAGVDAVIAPRDRAVGLTPTVHKVASGATRSTPFIQVTNLARSLESLKRRGIWLVGATGERGQPLYGTDLRGPLAVVMGAEGKGLRRLTREVCDHLVSIPMAGAVESLNVSVATGVVLFEAVRQRGT